METPLEKYLTAHSSLAWRDDRISRALDWIERRTHIHTNFPRMLSGSVQGQFLTILAAACNARKILEIGTFTGYSAVCLAAGMSPDGHLDALEINDELESLILEGWERAGLSDRISLHIGDARETLAGLEPEYDMVFIDANKREYTEYWEAVLPLVRKGGLIVTDDVLWDGKVYAENPDCDKQTQALLEFNDMTAKDRRVESVIIPLRDGLTISRKL